MRRHLTRAIKATLRFRSEVILLLIAGALLLWWGIHGRAGDPEPKQLPTVPAGEGPPAD